METHVGQLISNRMRKHSSKIMMRIKRDNQWINFTGKECQSYFSKVGHALLNESVAHQENIAIYSQNMPEWTFADVGALLIGAVPIPVYATNIANQAKYILKEAEIRILFVGEQEQYNEVLQIIDDEDLKLQRVIVFDQSVELTHPKTIHFKDWIAQDVAQVASTFKVRNQNVSSNDLSTIIYTSGTTGEPKGVMYSHHTLIETCKNHDIKFSLTDKDSSLAFLPLSHVFERIWTYYVMHKGMLNSYNRNPKEIAEVVKEVQPTVMCSVPRLYEKIYHMIYTKLLTASFIKRKLFHWAIKQGAQHQQALLKEKTLQGLNKIKYNLADKLVLSKIRAGLGGKMKFMPCGAAPLSKEITLFFRAVGLPIVIGYGLTETTATVTSFGEKTYTLGTVGKPMVNVEVKIGKNDEILVKGESIMLGYYKKPEETAKVMENGWFKTGDAGKWDSEGNLIITDRIKDLIKTSGGKYVAPQQIEAVLTDDNFIEQIVTIGESKPYITALIVPNFEALKLWANHKEIQFNSNKELIENPKVIEKFESITKRLQEPLANFEKIKKYTLMLREFTMEDNELTPTFKVKRKVIRDKYHDLIEKMYS